MKDLRGTHQNINDWKAVGKEKSTKIPQLYEINKNMKINVFEYVFTFIDIFSA